MYFYVLLWDHNFYVLLCTSRALMVPCTTEGVLHVSEGAAWARLFVTEVCMGVHFAPPTFMHVDEIQEQYGKNGLLDGAALAGLLRLNPTRPGGDLHGSFQHYKHAMLISDGLLSGRS